MAAEIGLGQIDWQQLQSWQSFSGIHVTAWEASTLKKMSDAYHGSVNKYSGVIAPPPYFAGVSNKQRQLIADKMAKSLSKFEDKDNGNRRRKSQV